MIMKYLILVTLIVFLFVLIGTSMLGRPETEHYLLLIAAESHSDDYPTSKSIRSMAKEVEEQSNGRIRIKLYAGAQLGAEEDAILANRMSSIDLNRVSLSVYNNIEPVTVIPCLPFIFRSIDHMHQVLDSEIGDEILASLEPHGLIGLAFYDSGARSFYNIHRPILHPSDMAGMKVRVQNADVSVAMIQALGACPTPMSFGEVYEALVTGVIDAAENNIPSYRKTRHCEVAKYYSFDQHTMVPDILTISKTTWDRLSHNDQQLIRKAAKASVIEMRKLWKKEVLAARSEVESADNQLIEDVDKAPFIDAMKPLYQQFVNTEELKELQQRILEVGT